MSGDIDPLSIPLPPTDGNITTPPLPSNPDDEKKRKYPDEPRQRSKRKSKRRKDSKNVEDLSLQGSKEEQDMIKRVMGFSNFDTTKGKMVPGNAQVGSVHVVKKRRYRQYMNRKGGFNRPLDKVA